MNNYELERMAGRIRRKIESKIAATTAQREAQIEEMSEFWRSYPGMIRETLAIGSPTTTTPAPAPPAPEPTLAQRLEEMEPQAFFAAMQADPRAMLAKIAQADQE